MKLPGAESAHVDIAKLRDYSLNLNHEEGKHKARVFAAALGLGERDAEWLRSMLLRAARSGDCQLGRNTSFGQRYLIDFPLRRGPLAATVRSVWNIRPAESFPRLVTCYVI